MSALVSVNEHCLDSIMKLSEKKNVVAAEDIYDSGGVKLWAKGAPVSRALQVKLLRRRLVRPLESTLSVEDGASLSDILAAAEQVLQTNPSVAAIGARALPELRRVATLPLPGPLTLLLTTARESTSGLFEHGATVALLACGIGAKMGIAGNEATTLAMAAIFHDLGEMYVNPEYLYSKRALSPAEWKSVAAHPRIGQLLLEDLTNFPRSTALAVAEHHERLNGSGYPRQLEGEQLSRAGSVLAGAEALSGILTNCDCSGLARASLAMRMVPGEFLRPVIDAVAAVQGGAAAQQGCEPADPSSVEEAQRVAAQLERAILCARMVLAAKEDKVTEAVRGIDGQLLGLLKSLRATGVAEAAALIGESLGPEMLLEFRMAAREIRWRMRNLARNLHLRAGLQHDGRDEIVTQLAPLIAILDGEESIASSTAVG